MVTKKDKKVEYNNGMTNMMFLAEKKIQAEKYTKAFKNSRSGFMKDKGIGGYFVCSDPELFNGEQVIITWASGHLVELKEPEEYKPEWKVWSRNTLPIIPEGDFEYKVSLPKVKQFKTIKYWMEQCQTIVWAGDLDREGSHISYLLSLACGVWFNNAKTFKRLWVKDLLPQTIKKGMNNLQSIDYSYRQALTAQSRAKADWLVGLNGTRFISLLLNELGFDTPLPKALGSVSIGRVMTPTLFMVRNIEVEIENFSPRTYYTLKGLFNHPNGDYFGELVVPDITMTDGKKWDGTFEKEKQWASFLDKYVPRREQGYIVEKITKEKQRHAPRLFTLGDLQTTMDKLVGLSPDNTLSIVQKLYGSEKKEDGKESEAYLTYPRSESQYITEEEYKEMLPHARDMAEWIGLSENDLEINEKPDGYYVNTKICGEKGHSAITPTSIFPSQEEYQSWDDDTKAVYFEVFKRTIAMFQPLYRYEESIVYTSVGNSQFKSIFKKPLSQGWRCLWDKSTLDLDSEDKGIIVNQGDVVKANLNAHKVVTKPKQLYTKGTLVKAMKTAGTTIDDEEEESEELAKVMKDIAGIGTPATRSDIVKKLFDKGQITLKKGKVVTTELGRLICSLLENEIIFSNPQATAKWELSLVKIEKGENSPERFLNNIYRYLGYEGGEKNFFTSVDTWSRALTLDNFNDLKEMITKKKNPILEGVRCPICENKVKYYDGIIICEKNETRKNEDGTYLKTGCPFFTTTYVGRHKDEKGKWKGGKKLTEKQIIKIMTTGSAMIKSIKAESGKKYDAETKLSYSEEYNSYSFRPEFGNSDETTQGDKKTYEVLGNCPKCGKDVYLYSKIASCSGNTKSGPTCNFKLYRHVSGIDLTDQDLSDLIRHPFETAMIKSNLVLKQGYAPINGKLYLEQDNDYRLRVRKH